MNLCALRSFLDFYPLAGSFQVNPPLCEELIEDTLQHIDRLLTDSMEPLRYVWEYNFRCHRMAAINLSFSVPCSFIVFLPESREPALQCLSLIEESHFKRRQVVVLPMEHEYRHGYQHVTT